MAFVKKIYLHPKFGSWSLLKLLSIYAHSSIEASLKKRKKSSWNSSHNQLNQIHGLTLTELTHNLQQLQQNTFSLQKGPCWSLEVNKPGKQTILRWIFKQHLKKYSNFLSDSRDGVCYVPCGFSQPIVLPGYLCGLREDLHQRDLPNAVTKKIFKTFQSQLLKCWYYRQFSELAIGR